MWWIGIETGSMVLTHVLSGDECVVAYWPSWPSFVHTREWSLGNSTWLISRVSKIMILSENSWWINFCMHRESFLNNPSFKRGPHFFQTPTLNRVWNIWPPPFWSIVTSVYFCWKGVKILAPNPLQRGIQNCLPSPLNPPLCQYNFNSFERGVW